MRPVSPNSLAPRRFSTLASNATASQRLIRSIVPAVATFAITNVDDIVLLALFFARADDRRDDGRIVVGQYLGFGGILTVALVATVGLKVISEDHLAYLGLLPIVFGIRAGVSTYRRRRRDDHDERPLAFGIGSVAGITFANGGDNIGVYVPVFTAIEVLDIVTYVVVFLVLVALWCVVGRSFVTRPPIARTLARWGNALLPIVLVAIGSVILIEGNAFGL